MSGLLNNAQSFIVRQSINIKGKQKKKNINKKLVENVVSIWQRKSSLNGVWEADIKYVLMTLNIDVRMSVQ